MKILVTGATGFLGQSIVKRFLDLKSEVHIIIRDNSDITGLQNLESAIFMHKYDGTIESMLDIFSRAKPECVIHLAAKFISEHKAEDISPIVDSNILLGIHLLEGMREHCCKRLITTGTNWQNDGSQRYKPVNLYAATKEAFEMLALHYVYQEEICIISLRIYDTYGPKDKRSKIINLFEKYKNSNEELEMSLGEQLLGMVYIDDVVRAYEVAANRIMEKSQASMEVFYLTPIKFYSLKEIAQCYQEIMETKLNILWGARPYRKREVMKPYIGMRLPGWEPVIDLQMGLNLIKKSNEAESEVF